MGQLLSKILMFENMQEAWEHVRQQGKTAGVDHWSVRRFQRHWEEHLRTLADEVRSNAYQPRRLRLRYIPKKGGGKRRLAIPTLRDRVLQRAALQVLQWRFERKFLTCSYGYRPKRSLFHAVAAIVRYRDRGLTWVLDADIDACFDSLDLQVLRPLLTKEINDAQVLRLIDLWLEVGLVNRHEQRGVAQGMSISPLLCNVYLHELDWPLVRGRWALVRYADDFIVLTYARSQAERCYEIVGDLLQEMHLRYEPSKTHITRFADGFQFLGVHFDTDSYSYTWEGKRVDVSGRAGPLWAMWDYFPHSYE